MDPNAVVSPAASVAHREIGFVGTVQAGWLDWLWRMLASSEPREVVLSVDEAFSGPPPLGHTTVVNTGWTRPECGYPFRTGETYLIYAYQPKEARHPIASICSRTAPLNAAAKEVAIWRQWATKSHTVDVP